LPPHKCISWASDSNHLKTLDNGVVYIARAFAQQPEFWATVAKTAGVLPPLVVSVEPSLGTDWNGEPAVFFQIVLSDGTLRDLTMQISQTIVDSPTVSTPPRMGGALPNFQLPHSIRADENRRAHLGLSAMAYADELLELAQDIANLHPLKPHQASLRRAVSTAYYALFHLLISEATANWNRPELRGALARVFDHGPMKQAAD